MSFNEGRPTNRAPGALYGPVRLLGPVNTAVPSATIGNTVECRGAKAVYIHCYSADDDTITFSGANPRVYQNEVSVLSTVAAESGVTFSYTSGATVDKGSVATYTPAAGKYLAVHKVGFQCALSAEATNMIVDAYVAW
jgi:hypothetical protein